MTAIVYTPNTRDSELKGVDLILFEEKVTECLKQEVQRANGLLTSFQYRLEMEDIEVSQKKGVAT